jgi:hypothetical protein
MMKKVVLASLLTAICAAPSASVLYAQAAPAAGAGQVQMGADEYAAYNNANTQTTPEAKAQAFQAYLKAYPNSSVKLDVLTQIAMIYSQTTNEQATLAAADALLAADPGNLRALALEVFYLRRDGDAATDPATKQADLDKAAGFAQQGLSGTGSKGVSPDDYKKFQGSLMPTFQSAIADDDIAKKDSASAITALKAELAAVPVADTQDPAKQLQDVYTLAQAYYTSTPPDYLNCAWYATRAGNFAPAQFKTPIQQLATYCYKKFHGGTDGYDAMQTSVATNLNPPAGFLEGIKPAPKPADMVHQLVTSTPDLATLALGDKETALSLGSQEDADKVFASVKGKSVSFPDVTVVSLTGTTLVLMVSDDANASKTPDFTVNLKEAPAKAPAAGDKVTVQGTYDSYTANPLMITLTDGSLVEKKAPAAKAPVRRAPAHR